MEFYWYLKYWGTANGTPRNENLTRCVLIGSERACASTAFDLHWTVREQVMLFFPFLIAFDWSFSMRKEEKPHAIVFRFVYERSRVCTAFTQCWFLFGTMSLSILRDMSSAIRGLAKWMRHNRALYSLSVARSIGIFRLVGHAICKQPTAISTSASVCTRCARSSRPLFLFEFAVVRLKTVSLSSIQFVACAWNW